MPVASTLRPAALTVAVAALDRRSACARVSGDRQRLAARSIGRRRPTTSANTSNMPAIIVASPTSHDVDAIGVMLIVVHDTRDIAELS